MERAAQWADQDAVEDADDISRNIAAFNKNRDCSQRAIPVFYACYF